MENRVQRETKDITVVLVAPFSINFGVYSLASFLKEKGYSCHVIDFKQTLFLYQFTYNDYFTSPPMTHDIYSEPDLAQLIDLLKDVKPDLIGISVTSVTMNTVRWMTRALKKYFDVPIVWGGVHAILCPEECIEEVDYVCIGEGEYPLYEIAEKTRMREEIDGVRNMWIRKGEHIQKNERRPLICNLDELPFSFRSTSQNQYLIEYGKMVQLPIVNDGNKNFTYPLMTSRGCMYKCSFCCNSVISELYQGLGPYMRRRSVDNVIQELREAVRHRMVHNVYFWDDIFTFDSVWIEEFCDRYHDEVGKPITCYAHPEHTKISIIEKLAKVGLAFVNLGIQSGSRRTNASFFNRPDPNKKLITFGNEIKPLTCMPLYDIICDNPFENDEDNWESSELLMLLPQPYTLLAYSLCFFPKTPLTERALKEGIIDEHGLEQHTSKAVNNFFLSFYHCKRKEDVFWNCIKIMGANPYFPNWFVRRMRSSKLMRRYPHILLSCARFWIFLFRQRGAKKKMNGWPVKAVCNNVLSEVHTFGKWILFAEHHVKCIMYSEDRKGESRDIMVNMCVKGKTERMYGFFVELMALGDQNMSHKSLWWVPYQEIIVDRLDFHIEFSYPDVIVKTSEGIIKGKLKKDKCALSQGEQSCIFRVHFARKHPWIPFRCQLFNMCQLIMVIKKNNDVKYIYSIEDNNVVGCSRAEAVVPETEETIINVRSESRGKL